MTDMPQRKSGVPGPQGLTTVQAQLRDPEPWVEPTPTPTAFRHCAGGLHIGTMHPEPKTGEFASVLTLAADPGTVEDGIRHRHIPLVGERLNQHKLTEAVDWTLAQFDANRTVLVRSDGGLQRPGLVVAATFLRVGATYFDAVGCVTRADPAALSEFQFLNLLKELAGR